MAAVMVALMLTGCANQLGSIEGTPTVERTKLDCNLIFPPASFDP